LLHLLKLVPVFCTKRRRFILPRKPKSEQVRLFQFILFPLHTPGMVTPWCIRILELQLCLDAPIVRHASSVDRRASTGPDRTSTPENNAHWDMIRAHEIEAVLHKSVDAAASLRRTIPALTLTLALTEK
jgi:hypothetical protein